MLTRAHIVTFGYYVLLLCLLYYLLIGFPLHPGIFYGIWLGYKNPWDYFPFPTFVALEAIFTFIPTLVYRRKFRPPVPRQSNTALIIPCHKSEQVISNTLTTSLKIFPPEAIFVVDNGSSPVPVDGTQAVCSELGVNYIYVPHPGKLGAIYVGARAAKMFDFVMQIDDDMYLPEDLSFPIKPDTHCIAYTISALSSKDPKIIHMLQDIEYKSAGISKGFEAKVGSATFAHGAISLWRRRSLINVLENHPNYPISDDWFVGFTANRLGYHIDMCDAIFIPTDVPSELVYSKAGRTTGYGTVTLFQQRFGRWYKLNILQVFYLAYLILFSWKLPTKRAIPQKFIWVWNISITVLVMVKILPMVIIEFNLGPQWKGYLLAFVFALNHLTAVILNYKQLRKHERLPYYMLVLFTFYKMYDLLVFTAALYYSLIFCLPKLLATPRTRIDKIPAIALLARKYS